MDTVVHLDTTDKKILNILIDDARTSLKDIAKKCGISSVSVLNRIKNLKAAGVIEGATVFPAIYFLGFHIVATIGIETDSNLDEIVKYLKDHTYLIEPSVCIGEYDLTAVIYAENIATLHEQVETIRRRFGLRKVIVNVWSGIPKLNFHNIDLNPLEER